MKSSSQAVPGPGVALVALAALCMASSLPAQQAHRGQATATLVSVPSLGPGTRAAVQRFGVPTRNLILVTDSATAGDLAAAVAVLQDSRRRNGEDVGGTLIARIPEGEAPALRRGARERFERQLEQVRSAGPRTLEGIGSLPAIDITLPPPGRSRR
jgi:hypothetical protein